MTSELISVLLLTLMAGLAMPLGALLASMANSHKGWLGNRWRHGIIAFGGGALLAAVALVLVPESIEKLSLVMLGVAFCAGGIAFCMLDVWLSKNQSPMGQLVAMLADFVPEAIALGAAFAFGSSTGLILAFLIAVQNLPEGFNAYNELTLDAGISKKKCLIAFCFMALLGPVSGLIGYLWLAASPQAVAFLMMFSSGGILYIVFQDIAPQVPVKGMWVPPLGAVLGFFVGVVGLVVVH